MVGSHGGHHVRRSLPDMGAAPTEPPKLYPYHLLIITNYRLPADVDRCNLEVSISSEKRKSRRSFTNNINYTILFSATFIRRRIRGSSTVYSSRILQITAMASKRDKKACAALLTITISSSSIHRIRIHAYTHNQ